MNFFSKRNKFHNNIRIFNIISHISLLLIWKEERVVIQNISSQVRYLYFLLLHYGYCLVVIHCFNSINKKKYVLILNNNFELWKVTLKHFLKTSTDLYACAMIQTRLPVKIQKIHRNQFANAYIPLVTLNWYGTMLDQNKIIPHFESHTWYTLLDERYIIKKRPKNQAMKQYFIGARSIYLYSSYTNI